MNSLLLRSFLVVVFTLAPDGALGVELVIATPDSNPAQPEVVSATAEKDVPAQDEIAGFFARKCSGCHTIGGGKLSGPDLLGVATWPVPETKAKIKAMEKNVGPLADGEIDSLGALLRNPEAKSRVEKAGLVLLSSMLKSLAPASAEAGKNLFTGGLPLSNGGLRCISCHTVNRWGGSLGPDLSLVGKRMGPNALISAIRNSDFKTMRPVFQSHPVTDQEAIHLAKYLGGLSAIAPVAGRKMSEFVGMAGIGGALLFLGLLPLLSFRRYRSARAKLWALSRQRK